MNKLLIILIGVILIILVSGIYLYQKFSQKTELPNNLIYCNVDTDCQVELNSCSCENFCGNIYHEPYFVCARACSQGEIKNEVTSCKCKNNKCVPN